MKKIDIEQWPRKEHFLNFMAFEDPFFNICADVKVTGLKQHAEKSNLSFFILSYFQVLRVVNQIDAFKYRIRGKEVVLHEKIRGSCPVMRPDHTFGYGYFDHFDTLGDFEPHAKEVIRSVKNGKHLHPKFDEDDMIHSSVIPWVSFRSIEHAKRLNKGDSIPKIVLGKVYPKGDDHYMPVSVSGHHALMDGLHAGMFFEQYESFRPI